MHHTRQMIVDAIQGSEYLDLRLGVDDTAWHPAMDDGSCTPLAGPGLVSYCGCNSTRPHLLGFDPLADDHDPRCDATNPEGDVCRLLPGDHLAHYWGEADGSDL